MRRSGATERKAGEKVGKAGGKRSSFHNCICKANDAAVALKQSVKVGTVKHVTTCGHAGETANSEISTFQAIRTVS